jgi:glycosyltransferase involved in cell wall biosynthesis
MSILTTVPDLEKPGGVAAYYAALRGHIGEDVDFCPVGSRGSHETSIQKWTRLLKDYERFCRMVKSGSYDLIHLNPSLGRKALIRDGLLLLRAKSLGKKVLVCVHGWDCACETSIRCWFLFLFRWVYFKADAFIVLASRFQSVLREFGYEKPIYVETTMVSDEVFSHAQVTPVCSASQDTDVNILFLSRIEKSKGIYEAIDAFRRLKAKWPSVTMTVAGDGLDRKNAEEYVGTEGIKGVWFLGWITGEQKHKAFAEADIYLLPTTWGEGMPISVLEAMAYGLPIVTRPVGGLADFFEQGKMGFTTDSRDPQVFASLLERLIVNRRLRAQIGRYNHSFARRNFTASAVAKRLMEIYRRTMHSTASP